MPGADRGAALAPSLRREFALALLLHAVAAVAFAWALGSAGVPGFGVPFVVGSIGLMLAALALLARAWAASMVNAPFGAANRVTLLRLGLALLLAASLAEGLFAPPVASPEPQQGLSWAWVALATLAAVLDAVDGPLARRAGTASAFGARFDMEADAWLVLVLSIAAWQLDRAGAWVLASGLMRYAFVAAAWVWPGLSRPLPPSRRRQAVCVAQIVMLIAALAPVWPPVVATALCAIGLLPLAWSFAIDVRTLSASRGEFGPSDLPPTRARNVAAWLLAFGAAFFVLNTLFTFESRLDGVGVLWSPRLSFELCIGVLALLAWAAWRGPRAMLGRRAAWALAALCSGLTVVRYVDVTVPAFFGRPLNLYWDAPHAWQLIRLAWSTWSPWGVLAAAAGVLLALAAVTAVARWAVVVLVGSMHARAARRWLAAVGALLVGCFVAYPWAGGVDTRWFFSLPMTPTLVRQAALLEQALSRERTEASLTPSPRFAGNLEGLRGADVLLLFAESYGITAFDQPAQAQALAAPRAELAAAVARGGRGVVTARVRSPTFGGASWLGHSALLAGVDTSDPDHYDLLLTTKRPTLVSHFAQHGYRTVGWMPGMQRPWPEGRFYGFERYADADGVGYRGPVFGYWRIPDQVSMALLHAQELAPEAAAEQPRRPRLAVFATLQTHAPFHPRVPYLAQWDRLVSSQAYTPAQVAEALAATGPPGGWVRAYVDALAYTYRWLGDYLDAGGRAAPSLVTVMLGDHQPLAAVAGRGASWDVPVHVITQDAELLARLRAAGFVEGWTPPPQTLGAMHELTRVLADAFDRPGVDVAGARGGSAAAAAARP